MNQKKTKKINLQALITRRKKNKTYFDVKKLE